MNPVIIIPSYWAETDRTGSFGAKGTYDFATPITRPLPELQTCLESIEQVRGVIRTIVLVVAAPSCADSARARVNAICRSHANINPLVIGGEESDTILRALACVAPNLDGENISLRGYGAIKNMGLAVAAIFGHDTAVFLDDDDTVLDENFLVNSVYGLGTKTKQKQTIVAKTGFLLSRTGNDSPFAPTENIPWADKYWSRAADFNKLMNKNLSVSRISKSNLLLGGCFSLHAQAYMNVPFDPIITRGEDLDYLINLRARGMDVWFDNEWYVRSQPPSYSSEIEKFRQDCYRWIYELHKIQAQNAQRNLCRVTPESLAPYPGSWLSSGVRKRIRRTALRRLISGPNRGEYLHILLREQAEAEKWAQANKTTYISFAAAWPHLMNILWDQRALQKRLLRTGSQSLGVG